MKHVSYYNKVCVCVFVCVFSSCKPDTACRENTKVSLVCEFRRAYFDEGRQPQIDPVWDSITAIGIGATDTLYNNSKGLVQISLPMHVATDSTLYTLRYHNQVDTICIRHSNDPYFISLECGCAVNHTIQQISHTNHWIDSIAVVDGTMTREGKANLEFWKFDYKL